MYKTQGYKGLFDEQFNNEKLSNIGNSKEAISKVYEIKMLDYGLKLNL